MKMLTILNGHIEGEFITLLGLRCEKHTLRAIARLETLTTEKSLYQHDCIFKEGCNNHRGVKRIGLIFSHTLYGPIYCKEKWRFGRWIKKLPLNSEKMTMISLKK
jgi:hypothetical protein